MTVAQRLYERIFLLSSFFFILYQCTQKAVAHLLALLKHCVKQDFLK